MKLVYKGVTIKEGSSKEELENVKREYVRDLRVKYSNLLDKYMKLNNERAYVLPRNPKDSDEEYMNKLIMVNKNFVENFEDLIKEAGFNALKITYKDVLNGKIFVKTEDDVISFGALNGEIRNKIPMMGELKIVD